MSGLCRATTARSSSGTASAVIRSLWPPFGAWTASALVILLSLTVIRTWTAPYWVCAASPTKVPETWAGPVPREAPALAFILSMADWRDFL